MNKKLLVGGLLLLSCGCQCMNNTEAGALGGGIFGGALGTMVGLATHHPLAGAAIGAAAGTATGALVGNSEDRREARAEARAAAYASQNPPLTLQDVARMSQQHVSDSLIIQQIRTTSSVYHLAADDITWLKQMGVSDMVILEMQTRRAAYVAGPARVVYVEPAPPPPVAVGVGLGYGWGR
jgi:hypothetical protein